MTTVKAMMAKPKVAQIGGGMFFMLIWSTLSEDKAKVEEVVLDAKESQYTLWYSAVAWYSPLGRSNETVPSADVFPNL